MGDFFKAGGFGMYPVLVFGFLSIASAVLYALRPERRFVGLIVAMGITTMASAFLGFSMGAMNTLRYIEQVPQAEQTSILSAGISESLHDVVLGLILLVIVGLVASAGAWRASRLNPVAARTA